MVGGVAKCGTYTCCCPVRISPFPDAHLQMPGSLLHYQLSWFILASPVFAVLQVCTQCSSNKVSCGALINRGPTSKCVLCRRQHSWFQQPPVPVFLCMKPRRPSSQVNLQRLKALTATPPFNSPHISSPSLRAEPGRAQCCPEVCFQGMLF